MAEIWDEPTEKAILGAVLTDSEVMKRLRAVLQASDFHAAAHARIWDAMLDLSSRGRALDHLTVATALRDRGHLREVGGPEYLMALDQTCPVVSNVLDYAEVLKDRTTRRRLAAVGKRLLELSGDLTQRPGDLQAKASHHLLKAGGGRPRRRTLTDHVREGFEHIHRIEEGGGQPIIPTGIAALDAVIGGWQPTLNIIGARTGVGKSAALATFIQNVAMQGYRVGVFSLEDEGDWLAWRYMAYASSVPQFVLRYRKKTDHEWEAIGATEDGFRAWTDRVTVDDRPGLTSEELCLEADDMIANDGVQIIFVDHLKEMNHHAKRRERHDLNLEASLQDMRAMQKRHRIPVVIAHQMNEDRDPKNVPTLFDFSDGKVVGKMARVAMALTREPTSDVMGIHILKQTGGAIGHTVDVRFVDGAAMIRNIEGAQVSLDFPTAGARATRNAGYTRDPERDT